MTPSPFLPSTPASPSPSRKSAIVGLPFADGATQGHPAVYANLSMTPADTQARLNIFSHPLPR